MASLPLPCRFRFSVIAASSIGITKTRANFSCFSSVPIRVTTRDHPGQPRTKSMSQSEATSDSNSSQNDVVVKTTRTTKEEERSGGVSVSEDVLVQYVVLRRDLIDTWPMGSVVTQGCHASVSAIWSHKDDPHTLQYCSPDNIDSMHKVTLEVKGQTQMVNLSEKLTAAGIAHKLWIEQPENFPTCLATKPYPKSQVSSFFKKLKLCK